jgi:hypothetical protein
MYAKAVTPQSRKKDLSVNKDMWKFDLYKNNLYACTLSNSELILKE